MSSLINRLGGTAGLCLAVLFLVLMPLAWNYHGNAVNLAVLFYFGLGLLVLLPLTVWRLAASTGPLAQARPLLVGLGLYLAVCTISSWVSVSPEISSNHWWLRLALVTGALLAVSFTRAPGGRDAFRLLVATTCTACAVWGCITFIGGPRRASGPFIDANNFALVCATGALLLLPELGRVGLPALRRLALWAALTVLTLALFCAYSRAVSLIWLGGVLAFTALAWRSLEQRTNLLAYVGLGAACYVITILLAPDVAERVTGQGDLAATLDVRQAMVAASLNIWRDHPLLGAGIGTFRVLYPSYRLTADQVTAGNTPHNDYLLGLVEGGPLLLVLYAAALVAVAWRGALLLRHMLLRPMPGRPVAPAAIGELALLLAAGGMLAHGMVNFVTITLALQFELGCLLGLLFALPSAAAPRADLPPGGGDERAIGVPVPTRLRGLLVGLTVLLLLLPLRVLAQDALAYAVFLGQRGMPFADGIRNDGRRFLAFAERLDDVGPTRGLPAYSVARYFDGLAAGARGADKAMLAQRASYFYALSIEHLPLNSRAFLAWSQLHTEPYALDLRKADALARAAQAIDPTDVQIYTTRVRIARQRKDERAVYDILRNEFFPWAYYGASTRALESERLLLQLRELSLKYRQGPSLEAIDVPLQRAGRVQEAIHIEKALGWRK